MVAEIGMCPLEMDRDGIVEPGLHARVVERAPEAIAVGRAYGVDVVDVRRSTVSTAC